MFQKYLLIKGFRPFTKGCIRYPPVGYPVIPALQGPPKGVYIFIHKQVSDSFFVKMDSISDSFITQNHILRSFLIFRNRQKYLYSRLHIGNVHLKLPGNAQLYYRGVRRIHDFKAFMNLDPLHHYMRMNNMIKNVELMQQFIPRAKKKNISTQSIRRKRKSVNFYKTKGGRQLPSRKSSRSLSSRKSSRSLSSSKSSRSLSSRKSSRSLSSRKSLRKSSRKSIIHSDQLLNHFLKYDMLSGTDESLFHKHLYYTDLVYEYAKKNKNVPFCPTCTFKKNITVNQRKYDKHECQGVPEFPTDSFYPSFGQRSFYETTHDSAIQLPSYCNRILVKADDTPTLYILMGTMNYRIFPTAALERMFNANK